MHGDETLRLARRLVVPAIIGGLRPAPAEVRQPVGEAVELRRVARERGRRRLRTRHRVRLLLLLVLLLLLLLLLLMPGRAIRGAEKIVEVGAVCWRRTHLLCAYGQSMKLCVVSKSASRCSVASNSWTQ